jgi:tetratricopeptide (TPR) repeat protein
MIRALSLSLFLLIVLDVRGQDSQRPPEDPEESQIARFQLAETFIQAGQYERAIPLLEELSSSNPGTHVFYERLRESYEQLKRYDDAIRLIESRIATSPTPEVFMVEKARLQFLSGMDEPARSTWMSVIDRQPTSPSVYLMVYRSLLQVRLFDYAIDVLERGRREMESPALFQTDLAQLYSLTSQHDKAATEYLALIEENAGQLNFVKSRLGQYLTDDASIAASLTPVEDAVARAPLNRSFRELQAWLYMEMDRFSEALTVYSAIDRLENEEGKTLFAFGLAAVDAGAFDVAMEAFEEVLTRHPEAPSAPDAMRGLGLMQEAWAEALSEVAVGADGTPLDSHYKRALDTYERFLIEYPQHSHVADVLQRMGRLHQDVFLNMEAAEMVLSEVIARYPGTQAADQAEYDMGRLAISTDRLTDARIRFTRLVTRLRTGELADAARFELARLHFYQGEFDTAKSLVESMQEQTSTDVANDAIEFKVMLNDNRGPDSLDTALRRYARAMLEQRQRQTANALLTLNHLLEEFGSHKIADDAHFRRAQVYEELQRYEDAIQAWLEMPLLYPKSFLGDRSLFQAARVADRRLGDGERAIALYERLLTEYPRSLLVRQARDHIRILRGEQV